MSGRGQAWRRRADAATGSRPVGSRGGPGGGVLDGIDALLADDDPAEGADPDSPKGEEDREPLL